MNSVRISEQVINQETVMRTQEDAVYNCGPNTVAVVIRNAFNSSNNVYIGWNTKPNAGNSIPPGTSVVYERVGNNLDGNSLYLGFPSGLSGGLALVTVYEEDC